MASTEELTATESARSHEPGLGPAVDFITRVVAPASLLTAILYYFGYLREHALFAYFGVDLGTAGLSTTDYVVRSAGTMFLPVVTLLLIAMVAVVVHHVLSYVLGRSGRAVARTTWFAVAVVAVLLLSLGVAGLRHRGELPGSPLVAPLALGGGAVLAEYAVRLAQASEHLGPQMSRALALSRNLRNGLVIAVVLVAAFWATADVAQQRGIAAARAIEASLPIRPKAVVFSTQRLQVGGPGVTLTELDRKDAAYAYRYDGLRPLIHSGGHWLLLPAGWTHDNGTAVIVLPDTTEAIRVDLAR
jgi:hypothetical protein